MKSGVRASSRRWIAVGGALFLGFVCWLVLRAQGTDDLSTGAPERSTVEGPMSPMLEPGVGRRSSAPAGAAEKTDPSTAPTEPSYTFRIGDYRAMGIEGVRIAIERASSDLKTWRTLAEGVTDLHGTGRFPIPALDELRPSDGRNLRIRLTPPAERDELVEIWKLWKPTPSTLWDFPDHYVVGGQVVDAGGRPVGEATVAVGHLGAHEVLKPQWFTMKTDSDGRFKFSGVPSPSDAEISVWAVPPGTELPERSSQVQGAVRTSLGNRGVTLRLP